MQRWQVEQVRAYASRPATLVSAERLALPHLWNSLGSDATAVWGRCTGSSSEPYECRVHHVAARSSCSCPSRVAPCKHVLALLLLWCRGHVPSAVAPAAVRDWSSSITAAQGAPDAASPSSGATPAPSTRDADTDTGRASVPMAPEPRDLGTSRDDRVARMRAGVVELDRWIDDRVRTGMADPSLARYSTWDTVAARLVDAQVGGLANRVRRLAGVVGAAPNWHEQTLAELGVLHLLAQGVLHLDRLPGPLADSVAVAAGWQVRQADVLSGVPHTDHWRVMGRSDRREDRIEVRRTWLRGEHSGAWAMVLSFAAYGQSLDDSLEVGVVVHADLHRYPGACALRALVGRVHTAAIDVADDAMPTATSVRDACASVGDALAVEPWLERWPVCMRAAPARSTEGWVLTDHTGSVPLVPDLAASVPTVLLACSGGRPVVLTAEWTPDGFLPVTVHLGTRSIDIGPRADPSFVAPARAVPA